MNKTHKLATFMTSRWTKWIIIVAWLATMAVIAPLAGKLTGAESNDAASWLPGKAESTQVLTRESTFQSSNVVPAILAYSRPSGLTAADRTKITNDAKQLAALHNITIKEVGPIISNDGTAAQIVVSANLGSKGFAGTTSVAKKFSNIAQADAMGLKVYLTGPLGQSADSSKAFNGIDSTLLFAALGVVTILLLITYRSPLLWLLPIISAGVALFCAEGIIYLLAKHEGLTVNAQSAGILTVLVFGAATDYALLLIARYREELHRHEDRHEAMALALHRAGPAIIASASTVIVGMLCLFVAELNSTKGLGPVAAIGIGVGLLVMITLLPALLVIFGRWLFWPLVPHYATDVPSTKGWWAKIGNSIAKRPRTIWIVTTAILGVMALGLFSLKANGLTTKQSYRNTPDSVIGQEILASHFAAPGSGEPLIIIANASAVSSVTVALSHASGITSVTTPIVKDGSALLQATLTSAPDSDAAHTTLAEVRTLVHAVPGANAMVGGTTAISVDTQQASRRDSRVIIPLVLIVVFVILGVLLRSIMAPLVLITTVLLSFAATLGICAVLFNHVLHFGGADPSFPLFVFVFLVALGIDYNIFLMTRIREEAQRHGATKQAAVVGLRTTGAVITSAGAVLAGTFAILATLPLTPLAEIGFTVALGVLLDTLVVRSVLVTSLTLDIGRWIWWPSKLTKQLKD